MHFSAKRLVFPVLLGLIGLSSAVPAASARDRSFEEIPFQKEKGIPSELSFFQRFKPTLLPSLLHTAEFEITIPKGGKAEVLWGSPRILLKPIAVKTTEVPLFSQYLGEEYAGGIQVKERVLIPRDSLGYRAPRLDRFSENQLPAFTMIARGRHGDRICKDTALNGAHILVAKEGVIAKEGGCGPGFDPAECLPSDLSCDQVNDTLSVPCPHWASSQVLYEGADINSEVVTDPSKDFMDMSLDPINSDGPIDVWGNGLTYLNSVDRLEITRVETNFDWEGDLAIGAKPNSEGEWGYLTEGDFGGAYANWHYSIVPCNDAYKQKYQTFLEGLPALRENHLRGELAKEANKLMRCARAEDIPTGSDMSCPLDSKEMAAYKAMQYLLHLAEGKMDEIQKEAPEVGPETAPAIEVHSLLPGPFWTKETTWKNKGQDTGISYDQCEWADTAGLAPHQSVTYKNFPAFGWTTLPESPESNDACVAMIVWEGDSSSTLLARAAGYIGPTDIADDFIGYFPIKRSETLDQPLTLTNFSGDMTLQVVTNQGSVTGFEGVPTFPWKGK